MVEDRDCPTAFPPYEEVFPHILLPTGKKRAPQRSVQLRGVVRLHCIRGRRLVGFLLLRRRRFYLVLSARGHVHENEEHG